MIITVGGLAGTGTTTTAEGLSEKLDIPYIEVAQAESSVRVYFLSKSHLCFT